MREAESSEEYQEGRKEIREKPTPFPSLKGGEQENRQDSTTYCQQPEGYRQEMVQYRLRLAGQGNE